MPWDWRTSYLEQAKSDYAMFKMARTDVPLCQSLHYLQMTTEKMAKGFLTRPGGPRYAKTHDAFIKFMRVARTRPEFRAASGFTDTSQFTAYVTSLLETAQQVENLSPEGDDHPNPEYPWEAGGIILVPTEYAFAGLTLENPKMIKLLQFIDDCLTLA